MKIKARYKDDWIDLQDAHKQENYKCEGKLKHIKKIDSNSEGKNVFSFVLICMHKMDLHNNNLYYYY